MLRRSLLVLLVGCNSHGEQPIPPDIREPEPPKPGPAAVVIKNAGVPVIGATVFFEDFQQGVQIVQTDDMGIARADIFANAFVTAVDPFGVPSDGISDVRTFAGVAPFDSLELTGGTPPQPPITITLTAPVEGTATRYAVTTSCGSGTLTRAGGTGTPTGQLALRGCNGRFDVLVETFDAGSTPRRSLYASNLTVGDGDTITLPNEYELIEDVMVQTLTRLEITTVAAKLTRKSPNNMLIERSFDIPIDTGSSSGTATVKIPKIVNGIQLLEARSLPATDDLHQDGFLEATSSTTQHFIDLFSNRLPRIVTAPTFNPPRSVFWGESSFKPDHFVFESSIPVDEGADFAILDLAITRGPKQWRWRVSAPHDGPAITLPTLPAEAGDLNIQPGDTVAIDALSLYDVPGVYDEIRGLTLDTKNPAAFLDFTFGAVVFEELR